MIIIIAIAGFLLLLVGLHFILRDFSRFIWKKTASVRFPASFVDFGEYATTLFITIVLSLFGLLFYKFATAFIAYLLSGDLISFFIMLRGVFSTQSMMQNPFNAQHLASGLFLTPALQFITFFLIYRGIRTFMFTVNRYYNSIVYSESDILYVGFLASILFISFEIIFYTQYIPTVSGVAHLTYLVVSKISVVGYYLSVAHLQLMRNQQYKSSLPTYVHLNKNEQSIIYSPYKTVAITYVIGVILYLPFFTGTQFLSNNLLLIFIYVTSCIVFYLTFRFLLSGGYNYLGVVMLVEGPENLSPNKTLFARKPLKIILILLAILTLTLGIFEPKLIIVFIFCALAAGLLMMIFHLLFYFGGLSASLLRGVMKKMQIPDIKLLEVFNYLFITAKSTFKASIPMIGFVLFVFFLLSFFPKELKYSNENNLHSVIDEDNNPLFIEQKDINGSMPVLYSDVPPFFLKCLYLQEDRGFTKQDDWMPNKSNWHGISISTFYRFFSGGGGSNINMQLIKNVAFPKSFPQDVQRKFSESLAAYQLSIQSSYQNIVTDYLNEVGMNGAQGHSGVMAASLYTFNLPVSALNPLEMMYLVSTLKRGSQFKIKSGYISYTNAGLHTQEIKEVLLDQAENWYKDRLITRQEFNSLKIADLRFVNKMKYSFCKTTTKDFFSNQIKTFVSKGFTYRSSISLENQQHMSNAVSEFERRFADQIRVGEYNLYSAALVVNVETGEIIGHYGGEGVTDLTQFSNGNPVGSLIKPFILLQLLENGFNYNQIRLYDGDVAGRYTPNNYNKMYSKKYMGIDEILKKSPNAPMVNTRLLTPPIPLFMDVEARFNLMGITSDPYTNLNDRNRSGEFEVNYPLGSRNMQLYQIAQAYQTLFNDGLYKELTVFTSVYYPELREWKKVGNKQSQIYSPENTAVIKTAMKGALESGGTAHQLSNILPKGQTFYAKTGTTDKSKNGYIVLSDGNILIVTSVKYYKNSNGNLIDNNAPSIPGGSGGKSAGVLAAMIYNQFKSN